MNIYLKVVSIHFIMIEISFNFINNFHLELHNSFEIVCILIQIHENSNTIISIDF